MSGDRFDVSTDGYFAILPEWLLYADVSDRAVRLYAILRRYAEGASERPSRATIAARMRTSVKSVDRALRELEELGAVTIRHRWADTKGTEFVWERDAEHPVKAPSCYVLHNSPARNPEGGRDTGVPTGTDSPVPTGRDTSDATVGTPVSPGVGTPVTQPVGTPVTHIPIERERESVESARPSAGGAPTDKSSRKRPAIRLPADWQPTEAHALVAAERGVDLETEARAFRLHAQAHDRRVVVWHAAFHQWLLKARPAPRAVAAGVRGGRAWQD
ncbi:helix-turn-helix domain-containing protein [Nocardia puris]|uniref:Helix-turn-helix protein n=1 Tax=Nocardia puris TaxID=208602 RepID=A0A366DBX0_9NOCA|nr:helix-turn-helix domain-containing protein [Nocardia puris]RBO87562.1 helix-turn-helix protein [Nocardia puris]